jgi:hypothetical protein
MGLYCEIGCNVSASTSVRLLTEIAGVGEGLGFGLDVGAGVGGVGVGVGGVAVGVGGVAVGVGGVGVGVGALVGVGNGVGGGVGSGLGVGEADSRRFFTFTQCALEAKTSAGLEGTSWSPEPEGDPSNASAVSTCMPLLTLVESHGIVYGGLEARYLSSRKTDTFLMPGPTRSLM